MRIIRLLADELGIFCTTIMFWWPGRSGTALRLLWAKVNLKSCGSKTRLGRNVLIRGQQEITFNHGVQLDDYCYFDARAGRIEIGANARFNRNVHLNASVSGTIMIGNDCIIGPNVVFRTANHNFQSRKSIIRNQGHNSIDIKIGADVWVGAGAIILPGVTLGEGCVIAAGAVVTKSFEPFRVIAGVPAKELKERLK